MIFSHPHQEEYYLGHLGRIRAVNGIESMEKTRKILKNRYPHGHSGGYSTTYLLAEASQMGLYTYIENHTIADFFAVSTGRKFQISQTEYNNRLVRSLGMNSTQKSAFFCLQCALDEYKKMGYSIWHRRLQLPGAVTCKIHQSALYMTKAYHAYEFPPHFWINKDHISQYKYHFNTIQKNYILRYNEFIERFLIRNVFFPPEKVERIFFEYTNTQLQKYYWNLRNTELWTIITSRFPKDWLANLFSQQYDDVVARTNKAKVNGHWEIRCPLCIGLLITSLVKEPKILVNL